MISLMRPFKIILWPWSEVILLPGCLFKSQIVTCHLPSVVEAKFFSITPCNNNNFSEAETRTSREGGILLEPATHRSWAGGEAGSSELAASLSASLRRRLFSPRLPLSFQREWAAAAAGRGAGVSRVGDRSQLGALPRRASASRCLPGSSSCAPNIALPGPRGLETGRNTAAPARGGVWQRQGGGGAAQGA